MSIYLFKPPYYAIRSVPRLLGHAIAYRWRSLPKACRHRASKPRDSSKRVLPWQVTMDQLICASPSHTHYWYEVGMLKVVVVFVPHKKTNTLHGGQSHLWSAKQGKENKKKKYGSAPPPPYAARSEKTNKNHVTHLLTLRRSRSVSRPYKDSFHSSTRSKGVASQKSTLPCAITSFPVSVLPSSTGDV